MVVNALFALLGLAAIGSSHLKPTTLPERLARGNNRFGIDLMQALGPKGDANLLVSPISVTMNLQLLMAGTSGPARVELERALHVGQVKNAQLVPAVKQLAASFDTAEGSDIRVANSIWLSPKFRIKPSYAELAKNGFGARATELKALGAAGAAEINGWVSSKTKGRIPELMGPLDASARVILVNALTFDGKWQNAFKKEDTTKRPFHGAKGTTSPQTMALTDGFAIGQAGAVRVIQLPYQGHTSMLIALPDAGGNPVKATSTFLNLPKLNMKRVDLQLPKFTFRDEHQLVAPLKALGVTGVFTHADFREISADPQLTRVSEIVQKTYVKVDEEGTEAAAATGTVVSASAIMVRPPATPFHVDHPFAFAIRDDKSGAILFVGIVKNLQ